MYVFLEENIHSGQNRQKTVWRSAFFVNSALKIQCDIFKNTLLQTVFRRFCPLGLIKSWYSWSLTTSC